MKTARAFVFVAFAAGASALADDPPPLLSGEASGSYTEVEGNSRGRLFGGSLEIIRTKAHFALTFDAIYLRTSSQGSTTSERTGASLRGEQQVFGRVSAYSQASYFRDPFAGVSNREIGDVGFLVKALKTSHSSLALKGALSRTHEQRIPDDPKHDFWGGRTGFLYGQKLSKESGLEEWVDFLYDFSDPKNWRIEDAVVLSVMMTRVLALKVSYGLSYTNIPPQGKLSRDTTFLVSVAAKWPKKKS